mmetsp:Transcript_17227/g.29771  ORF Transcript_17227/g.29771 Transcript_17227/m.29771 type:complete len:241 (-) Transcript_17227:1285-2007(-)
MVLILSGVYRHLHLPCSCHGHLTRLSVCAQNNANLRQRGENRGAGAGHHLWAVTEGRLLATCSLVCHKMKCCIANLAAHRFRVRHRLIGAGEAMQRGGHAVRHQLAWTTHGCHKHHMLQRTEETRTRRGKRPTDVSDRGQDRHFTHTVISVCKGRAKGTHNWTPAGAEPNFSTCRWVLGWCRDMRVTSCHCMVCRGRTTLLLMTHVLLELPRRAHGPRWVSCNCNASPIVGRGRRLLVVD